MTRRRPATRLLGVWIALIGCATVASPAYASFGVSSFAASFDQAPPAGSSLETLGPPDLQAGSHPYQVTTSLTFNTTTNAHGETIPDESLEDLQLELPPGLVGNSKATPQCSMVELASGGLLSGSGGCPADTQVGVLTLRLPTTAITAPVFNLVAPAGVAAQFGVDVFTPMLVDLGIRAGDYGTVVSLHDVTQAAPLVGISMALWGVPADPGHDGFRGACLKPSGTSAGSCPSGAPPTPLLTMPTSCGEALTVALVARSWQNPGRRVTASASQEVDGVASSLAGCDRLHFAATTTVQPEASAVDTPSGLSIGVSMPRQESAGGLAEANLKDISVELPAGLSVNPASTAGLGSCSPAQIGLGEASPPACPASSTVGTFEARTPVLGQTLRGGIYVATPPAGPFDGVMAVYLAGEADGLALKLTGQLAAQPGSGQLTFGLHGAPDLPLDELKIELTGGPRATLATPLECGAFTTTSVLTPYSTPESGPPDVQSSSFAIDEGCGGGFKPSLAAGSTTAAAGQGTGFALRLARADGQQYIQTFTTTFPAGLLGDISSVALCVNAEAAVGACPASSEVGTVTVGVGAGPDPDHLSGRVYLTGPYEGAPYGMAMVIPAAVGPFEFGTIVVRGKVAVQLATSSLSISTDPFPASLDGIPLRVRDVELLIDRPGFMVNPTDCAQQTISGVVDSTAGASVLVSAPFRVVGCAQLSFAPKVVATTLAGASSRGNGASLRVKITTTPGAHANLASVALALPKPLEPRLGAVQQACLGAVFAVNRRACPPASVVGRAVIDTPVLNAPLAGPVYTVFARGTKYPRLVTVLAGGGLEVQMAGSLEVHGGRGDATFTALPDVPMSLFELDLPDGRSSLLGATEDLCAKPQNVGYTIGGQNGAQRRGGVAMVVEGCHARAARGGRSSAVEVPRTDRRRG